MEPLRALAWLRHKIAELKGNTPLAALAAGNHEQVRAVALTLLGGPSA